MKSSLAGIPEFNTARNGILMNLEIAEIIHLPTFAYEPSTFASYCNDLDEIFHDFHQRLGKTKQAA
jgi:hypothetical protein